MSIISDLADPRLRPILDWSDVEAPRPLTGHSLNVGLEFWTPIIRGKDGGLSLRDIRRWRECALTNGPTWGGPLDGFGFGSLAFIGEPTGGNDTVLCGEIPLTDNLTLAITLRHTDTSTDVGFVGRWSSAGTMLYRSGSDIRFYGGNGGQFMSWTGGAATLADGKRHRLVGTKSGTNGVIYFDGRSVATSSLLGASTGSPAGIDFQISSYAERHTTPQSCYTGAADDAKLWSRALSASEASVENQDALWRWPLTVRRRPRTSHFIFPAAASSPAVTPAAAIARATAIGPTVQLGSLALTPANAPARTAVVAPTVRLGSLSLTPATARARTAAGAPSVQQSSLSMTPAAAIAKTAAVAPIVSTGGVQVTPAPAAARTAAVAPTVRLGSLSVTPLAAICRAVCLAPTVSDGSVKLRSFPGLVTRERVGALTTVSRLGGSVKRERVGSQATHARKSA